MYSGWTNFKPRGVVDDVIYAELVEGEHILCRKPSVSSFQVL